jgi:hypothetical protein
MPGEQQHPLSLLSIFLMIERLMKLILAPPVAHLANATRAGTAADLTTPPVTGAPAQASSKSAAPIDGSDAGKAAKALASRRESTTLNQSTQEKKAQLKEFVQDDRHFSLVR